MPRGIREGVRGVTNRRGGQVPEVRLGSPDLLVPELDANQPL